MAEAYKRLPEDIKKRIDGLRAKASIEAVLLVGENEDSVAVEFATTAPLRK